MPVSAFGTVPEPETGTIAIWDEPLSEIPAGWLLCDGNNGTPDLLGSFPAGVPDAGTNPGTTGGTNSHTLSTSQLPQHNHSSTTSTDGAHSHELNTDGGGTGTGQFLDDGRVYGGDFTYHVTYSGSHNHSLTVQNTGSGASIDNRPLYYEAAYIMKT